MAKMQVKPLTMAEMAKRYGFNSYTSEALHRGQQMESEISKVHEMKAVEIDKIRQLTSKGFRVIDIDPNQLTRSEYTCVYSQEQIQRLVGTENQYEGGASRIDNTGAPTASNTTGAYWRSVTLEIPGTFLKIEFLPARTAETSGSAIVGVDYGINNIATNIDPQNTNIQEFVNSTAAKRTIFLDFENPSDSPHMVNDGDVFKTAFTKTIITFKQLNVKIRITIGYNSEIQSTYQPPNSLYLWKGEGFVKNSAITPIPFCLTDADVKTTDYDGIAMAGSTQTYTLFQADKLVGYTQDIGACVLFMSSFTGMSYQKVTTDAIFQCQWDLFIAEVDAVGTVLSLVKRVANFSQSHTMIGGANGVGFSTPQAGSNWTEPLRVVLKSGQGLVIRLIPMYRSSAFTFYMKFEVSGYSMGRMVGSGFSGTSTPFMLETYYREHPYPQDNDLFYFPRT